MPLATARHIRPNSKLETEKKHLMNHDMNSNPLDVSFMPDPTSEQDSLTPCPYNNVGGDITIASPLTPAPPHLTPENALDTVTAIAEQHLQKRERDGNG